MQLLNAYKTEALINGMVKTVVISIEVENETDVDLSYMEPADIEATQDRLERGVLDCLWVKVTARFSDLEHFEGLDTLGQVFSTSKADTMTTVEFHDMAKNAIDELVANVLKGHEALDLFLKAA
jgi:hypothetical protein